MKRKTKLAIKAAVGLERFNVTSVRVGKNEVSKKRGKIVTKKIKN